MFAVFIFARCKRPIGSVDRVAFDFTMVAVETRIAPRAPCRRFTADWAKDNERRAAAQQAEQQRMADFYARQTQQQEERENAEARERFAALQRKNSM